MEFARQIDVIDSDLLWQSVETFISHNLLWDYNQLSVTSVDGDNDWTCSAGKIADLKYPQKAYSQCIEWFKDSPVQDVINKYNKFYRWRIMKLDPSKTYSLHKDGVSSTNLNIRLHIPLKTNEWSFTAVQRKKEQPELLNMKADGSVYFVNQGYTHSAWNFGKEDCIRLIVAVNGQEDLYLRYIKRRRNFIKTYKRSC